jgi:outer membrane receptor protein involved in Fe transport
VHDFADATVKLRGSYGKAIRAPYEGAKDSIQYSSNFFQLPNPNLRPEQQSGPDGGVDLVFGRHGSLSVTYYNQTGKDFNWTAYDFSHSPNFYAQVLNVAKVRNTGWEFEGTWQLSRATVRGQFAITHSRVLDPGEIPISQLYLAPDGEFQFLPKQTGALTLTATPIRQTTFSGTMAYVGPWQGTDSFGSYECTAGVGPCDPTYTYPLQYPGYTKFNLSLERELRRGFTGYVNVQDVTNSGGKRSKANTSPLQGRISTLGVRLRGL